jgi:hypothetical protein
MSNGQTIENPGGVDMASEQPVGDLSKKDGCATEEPCDLNEPAEVSIDNAGTGFMAFIPAYSHAPAAYQAHALGGGVESSSGEASWTDERIRRASPLGRAASDEALIALLAGCAKGADAAAAPPSSPLSPFATPPALLHWPPAPAPAPHPPAPMAPALPAQSDADIAYALASCSAATRSELGGGDDGACWLHVAAMP